MPRTATTRRKTRRVSTSPPLLNTPCWEGAAPQISGRGGAGTCHAFDHAARRSRIQSDGEAPGAQQESTTRSIKNASPGRSEGSEAAGPLDPLCAHRLASKRKRDEAYHAVDGPLLGCSRFRDSERLRRLGDTVRYGSATSNGAVTRRGALTVVSVQELREELLKNVPDTPDEPLVVCLRSLARLA